jgi:CheY-like chemotaxis protein
MPDMNGYEVCRILKEQENTRDIPVIFITALIEETDEVKGFSLGTVDYIKGRQSRKPTFLSQTLCAFSLTKQCGENYYWQVRIMM